jgi:hypothetical protein
LLLEQQQNVHQISWLCANVERNHRQTITYDSLDSVQFKAGLEQAGLPEYNVMMVTSIAEGIAQGLWDLPSDDLKNILGREPVGVRSFLETTFEN